MATTRPVELTIPEAELLADLVGIQQDLASSERFTHRLLKELDGTDPDLIEALSISMSIRYSRAFAEGVRTAGRDRVLARLPQESRPLHEFLRELRNKHVAHSVNSLEENRIAAMVSDRHDACEVRSLSTHHSRSLAVGRPTLKDVLAHVQELKAVVKAMVKEETESLLAHVREQPYELFRDRPTLAPFDPDYRRVGQRR